MIGRLRDWIERQYLGPRRRVEAEARRFRLKQQLRASGGRVAFAGRGFAARFGPSRRELESLWAEICREDGIPYRPLQDLSHPPEQGK